MEVYKLKVLNKVFRKNYNVCISISLFKMNDPYRDFGKYVAYLYNWIFKIPKNYFVRLYIDEVTLKSPEFEKIIESSFNNLEIFLYNYPEYKDNSGYHDGTFGSISRFLILFDNDFKKNYSVDYIWISDSDVQPFYFDPALIKDMKNRRIDICYMSKSTYNVPWIPDSVDYPVINAKIIIKNDIKFSKYNFDKYLRDILDGKYKEMYDKIVTWNSYRTKKTVYNPNQKYFIYGFDEIYSNQILYKEFLNYKRLIIYYLDLALFQKIPTIDVNIPNYEIMDELNWKYILKGDNSKMKEYIELNDSAYEYLKTLPLTLLSTRMKKAYDDYKKYRPLLNSNNKEFAVFLLVNPV